MEESLKKNAQGILSSTMRKEINSLVKESLMEQEEVVEPEMSPEDVATEDPAMMSDETGMEMDPSMVAAEPAFEDPEMMGDENTVAKPERRKGNENQRHEKTRSKNTDVMGDDANPGMRKIFIGKGARRRDAVGKMRTDARRESLSVRDTRPALYFNIAHYSLLTF